MKTSVSIRFASVGAISTLLQVLLIRNLLQVSQGNELVLGLLLGIYIMASGAGSLLSPHFSERHLPSILLLLSVLLPATAFLSLIPCRVMGLMSGQTLNLWQILVISMATLGIDGFVLGIAYGILFEVLRSKIGEISRGYFWEAVGSGLAGVLFTFLLATRLYSIQIAALLSVLALLIPVGMRGRRRGVLSVGILLAVLAMFAAGGKIEHRAAQMELPGYLVRKVANSRYGKIIVAERGGETTLFHNGSIFVTWPNPDFEHVEALSHMTVYASDEPSRVLLIGGGPDVIREVLKHPEVRELIYAQPDPEIVRLMSDLGLFPNDDRLRVVFMDAKTFLIRYGGKLGAIVMDIPPPATITLNRYYTAQFWRLVDSRLERGGTVGFTLPWSLSYVPQELEMLNASVLNALRSEFAHAVVMSDGENLFLASDSAIHETKIIRNFEKNPVDAQLFSREYVLYRFSRVPIMEVHAEPDDDLKPTTVFYGMTYWSLAFSPSIRKFMLKMTGMRFWHVLIALIVLTAIFAIWTGRRGERKVRFVVFTTGLTGMAFDVIPLMVFQIKYGYIYETIGLMVALFHVGLAVGSIISLKLSTRNAGKWLLFSEIGVILVSVAMLFLPNQPAGVIFLIAALGGVTVGWQFPLSVRLSGEHAGRLYGLDMAGGALAAITITPFLLPISGFYLTVLSVILLKLASLTTAAIPASGIISRK